MRALAAIVLLLASLVFAEAQDSVYFLALQAEEAGDIPGALSLFEKAVELPGPNTDEIRDILKDYYEAIGLEEDGTEGSVSFRFLGDAGAYALHYNEYGGVHALKEYGGDFFTSVEVLADFYSNGWMNTFGFSFMTDWYLNEKMPTLDTNDWVLTPGIEYALLGESFMWNMGVDFRIPEGNSMAFAWYNWVEKTLIRYDRQTLGVSLWDYVDNDGPMVLALYATWRRTAPVGLNASVSFGARFDADSVVNVEPFWEEVAETCELDPEGHCVEPKEDDVEDSEPNEEEVPTEDVPEDDVPAEETLVALENAFTMYWGKWLGPSLRARASYKFRYNISVDAKLNLFYGFVVDWPCDDGDDMQKFSGTWGAQINWSPSFYTVYFGVEQMYLHYVNMSDSYVGLYPKNSFLTEAKLGIKAEF